jgi:antitoxin FitA
MSRMVQVKGVQEGVHRALKSRAALRGQTLSDYLRGEMERLAARPSPDELMVLLERDAPGALGESAAPEVRRSRERAA